MNDSTNGNGLIATDAAGVCRLLPFGVRTWRRLDASAKVPRGHRVGQRKLWNVADLRRWSELGYPDRATFERQAAEVET